jgi:hypothetical protein
VAVGISSALQRLQRSLANAESRPSTIGAITLEVKKTGERSLGNPNAAFDVAGLETRYGRDNVTLANERARNREYKLRPKPARQSSTLSVRGSG